MKIEIKSRFSGKVLFQHTQEGNSIKITVEAAVNARANLAGANFAGANLARAKLAGANFAGANFAGANFAGANFAGASLEGAILAGAILAGANFAGANFAGASLEGAILAGANFAGASLDEKTILKGSRPIFQVGPIGSRCAYFVAYIATRGLIVSAGCFREKTIAEFREKLANEHGENKHAQEYEAALTLIEKHAELWADN